MTLVKKNTGWFPDSWNRLFDWEKSFFPGSLLADDQIGGMEKAMQVPSVNISETDKEYHIDLAMPGKKKEDFKIKVEGGSLSISSEQKDEKEDKQKDFHRKEFSYNYFSRSFRLPTNSEPEKLAAKYEDGILKVVLPKKEVAQAKPTREIKVD